MPSPSYPTTPSYPAATPPPYPTAQTVPAQYPYGGYGNRGYAQPVPPPMGGMEPMVQMQMSPNGLITVRYPMSFNAHPQGADTIIMSRSLPDGTDEAFSFVAVVVPSSYNIDAFAAGVHTGAASRLNLFNRLTYTRAVCNGVIGIEMTGTWMAQGAGTPYYRRSCAFIRNGHGYVFAYSVPQTYMGLHQQQLRAIVETTTFNF